MTPDRLLAVLPWVVLVLPLAGFTSLLAVRILGHLIAPLFGLMVQA